MAAKFQTSRRNQNEAHYTRTINPDSVSMSNSQQTSVSTSNSVSHTQQIEKLNRNESRKMHPPASSSWTPTAVNARKASFDTSKDRSSNSNCTNPEAALTSPTSGYKQNEMQTGAKGRSGNQRQTQQPTTAAASLTGYTSINFQRVAESGDSGLTTQTRGHRHMPMRPDRSSIRRSGRRSKRGPLNPSWNTRTSEPQMATSVRKGNPKHTNL